MGEGGSPDRAGEVQPSGPASGGSNGAATDGKPKHPGGRPVGSKNKPTGPAPIPTIKVDAENRIVLEELKKAGVEIPPQLENKVEFTQEEVRELLSLVFQMMNNGVLGLMQRTARVSMEEADRWAKCTEIVYRKYLQNANASTVIHLLLTASIMGPKYMKPAETGGKEDGGKNPGGKG